MGTCYSCQKELTLKEEEIKCDHCGQIVNYPCHNCKKWFFISETSLCKTCGFYVCPNCQVCGYNCQKSEWEIRLKEIIGTTLTKEQLSKIIELIEDIKIGKDRRLCPNGISISYAKSRIKRCFIKISGYKVKSQKDLERFEERYETILDEPLGKTLTINDSREDGSYGQEYRDVFNLCICEGKLEKKIIKKEIDASVIEYEIFIRCEKGQCPKLDLKNLIIKQCSNKNCKIKVYPRKELYCVCPKCKYTKDSKKHKKGDLRELKLKISNKDICQLNRGEFKKDGESKSKRDY